MYTDFEAGPAQRLGARRANALARPGDERRGHALFFSWSPAMGVPQAHLLGACPLW